MTIQEAYNFFENLTSKTTKKYEIKVYEKFHHILTELKIRAFSKDEIKSIETELDSLSLKSNPENRKKYFKKALSKFEKYLKDTFSLTSKRYYTSIGLALGSCFGSSFGVLLGIVFLSSFERSLGVSLSISFGIIIGMSIGLIIGRSIDTKAISEGRVL